MSTEKSLVNGFGDAEQQQLSHGLSGGGATAEAQALLRERPAPVADQRPALWQRRSVKWLLAGAGCFKVPKVIER